MLFNYLRGDAVRVVGVSSSQAATLRHALTHKSNYLESYDYDECKDGRRSKLLAEILERFSALFQGQ